MSEEAKRWARYPAVEAHRNARMISNCAIRFSRVLLSATNSSRTLEGFPSLAMTRRKNEATIGSAHQTAEVTESARHSRSGTYHFELTPSKTATRGYLELLGTLLCRSRLDVVSVTPFAFWLGLKAPSAVFAASA